MKGTSEATQGRLMWLNTLHVPTSLCRSDVMLELYLVYSLSLPTNGVIIQVRAGCALMPRHVHTYQVQVLWQELKKKNQG